MGNFVLWLITILCGGLIVYHHLVYPLILKRWSNNADQEKETGEESSKQTSPLLGNQSKNDSLISTCLPSITIVIPTYNEAEVIAEKIRNLAFVDYPRDRLSIVIADDGSTDATVEIARRAIDEELGLSKKHIQVSSARENLGKVAVLNKVLENVKSDLVLLSDASALISIDALKIIANHMHDAQIGIVAGTYRILDPGSDGEESYWQYQTRIKQMESATGSTLGVHGALYCFRRALFEPLPADTINDDFILPMTIVAKGFRCIYEPAIVAVELEKVTLQQDQKRRRRISAGNVQQVLRLHALLHPRYGAISFNFISGKFLRVIMPWCLSLVLICTCLLAANSILAATLLGCQATGYGLALLRQQFPAYPWPKAINLIHYLVAGHVANGLGCLRYLLGLHQSKWERVVEI